jgi:hypothetical protein
MTATYNEVSRIMILVDIEDPLTRDKDFKALIKYGLFARSASEFSDKNRAFVRSEADGDKVTDLKFNIEIYTDRLSDFVQACMVSDKYQRALIFQRIDYIQPPPEVLEDVPPEHLDEYTEIVHYYELKTLRKMTKPLPADDEEEDDEDEDELESSPMVAAALPAAKDEELEVDDDAAELSRQMDAESSLFLPASKARH